MRFRPVEPRERHDSGSRRIDARQCAGPPHARKLGPGGSRPTEGARHVPTNPCPFDGSDASTARPGRSRASGPVPSVRRCGWCMSSTSSSARPAMPARSSYMRAPAGHQGGGRTAVCSRAAARAERGGVKVQTMLLSSLTGTVVGDGRRGSEGMACRPHRDRNPWPQGRRAHPVGQRRGTMMRIAPVPVMLVQAARRAAEAQAHPSARLPAPGR